MSPERIHFKGLNAVRFLAASMVAVSHATVVLMWSGRASFIGSMNPDTGKIAVICFFVLSGFLITYLLLAEERHTGSFSTSNFYARRVLRIWPLYYFLVLAAFFVFPKIPSLAAGLKVPGDSWGKTFFLYLSIFPNLAAPFPYLGHLWSIVVEEQFYIVWPLLLRASRSRMRLIGGIIVSYVAVLLVVERWHLAGAGMFHEALYLFRIDCICLGALGAQLLFDRSRAVLWLARSKRAQLALVLVLVALYAAKVQLPPVTYELYALLFAALIVAIAANERSFLCLDGPVLDTLGKISYGIYMYHPLAIMIAFVAVRAALGDGAGEWLFSVALYTLGLTLTVAIALLSYYGFERRFLRLKLRFSRIVTGDLVTGSREESGEEFSLESAPVTSVDRLG
jgi:peptidoglycan/LPS O-acetylase OafA/YrhL